jgi:hypothetical protein
VVSHEGLDFFLFCCFQMGVDLQWEMILAKTGSQTIGAMLQCISLTLTKPLTMPNFGGKLRM